MYRISQGALDLDPLNLSFSRLLALTRQFEATDPRDRIFGLLGIPTTDSDPDSGEFFMAADYSLSVLDIYRNLARKVLQLGESSSLLTSVQHGEELDSDWPSWIPRWDKVYTHALSPSDSAANHSTSADTTFTWTFPSPNIIVLKGIEVDSICEHLPKRRTTSGRTYLVDFQHYGCQRLMKLFETNAGLKTLCWTLTAGKGWYGLLVDDHEKHVNDFASYVKTLHPELAHFVSHREGGDIHRFLDATSNACDERRLFFTESGYLGLGPAALRNGDCICVLFGGSMPFVLRPKDDHFRLVGECYVYDLMNGQAIKMWKEGKLNDRHFEIR
jgi:hypothetical protein